MEQINGDWQASKPPITSAQSNQINTPATALRAVRAAWPCIIEEVRAVLGGEQHYQAVVYHCLRISAVPRGQLGMNVKQWIEDCISPVFLARAEKKSEGWRYGFEPIPDVAIFHEDIASDWRRRNWHATLRRMLLAVEIKASERDKGRLSSGAIISDIHKLAGHRAECEHRGGTMAPLMMILDTAPELGERMTERSLAACRVAAAEHRVSFAYLSRDREEWTDNLT